MADLKSPTERFSNRVDNYTKYRPSYPQTVINYFQDHCELNRSSIVADVGSGTGIFTELLLQGGYHVFAVEPNEKMRRAAEDSLSVNPRFRSVKGKAERTGLDSHSIDLVTVAQAFHWFRHEETLLEFRRIIKPSRRIALVWNQRKINNPFQKAYDQMLRIHVPDYDKVNHRKIDNGKIGSFLDPFGYQRFSFENHQHFNLEGLAGRMQSSSYAPTPEMPQYAELMDALREIFQQYAIEGYVKFEYETLVHIGRPNNRIVSTSAI